MEATETNSAEGQSVPDLSYYLRYANVSNMHG